MIGSELNEKQIAVLQAISDASGGAKFANIESLEREMERMNFRILHDAYGEVSSEFINKTIEELEKKCLVERKKIKDKPYVGLTEDGYRCNYIDPIFPMW